MDTQGNFSHDSDQKLSTRIFALSTLLSSLQIFNVDKQLQANDLEYLQVISINHNIIFDIALVLS